MIFWALLVPTPARGGGAPIKILGEGESPKNLRIQVARVSAAARSKIEAAGGEVELSGSSE